MNSYYEYDFMRNNENYYVNNSTNLVGPGVGFIRGNLFKNLYSPYKNYQPRKIIARNDREKKLLELSEVSFAAHELNLYLDLHPEDQSMFLLFQDYEKKCHQLTEEFESMYGPLKVSSPMQNFSWVNDEWPWEGQNV